MPDQFVRPVIDTLDRLVTKSLGPPISRLDFIAECNLKLGILQLVQKRLIAEEGAMLLLEMELQLAQGASEIKFLETTGRTPERRRKAAGRSAK
jgi:hypothetical protein